MNRAAGARHGPATSRDIAFAIMGACLVIFIVAPLLTLVLSSSFDELAEAVADAQVLASIRITLLAALTATIACTVLGVPLAYLLARKTFPGKAILLAALDLPVVIPHPAAGLALLMVVGRNSLFGATGHSLVGTFPGIAAAMGLVSAPYLINATRAGFLGVSRRSERAARSLGASPWRVFFSVSLPLAWRDILSGMILMWARGISEFGAVIMIAYHPMTTAVMIFQRFNDYGLAYARSVAVLLILICISILALVRLLGIAPAIGDLERA